LPIILIQKKAYEKRKGTAAVLERKKKKKIKQENE